MSARLIFTSNLPFSFSLLYRRIESISDNIDRFGYSMCDASTDEIITEQKGVFRTNCLDWYVGISIFAVAQPNYLLCTV